MALKYPILDIDVGILKRQNKHNCHSRTLATINDYRSLIIQIKWAYQQNTLTEECNNRWIHSIEELLTSN